MIPGWIKIDDSTMIEIHFNEKKCHNCKEEKIVLEIGKSKLDAKSGLRICKGCINSAFESIKEKYKIN